MQTTERQLSARCRRYIVTDRESCYQQEERTDNLPANAPVETRTKAKHLLHVLAELVHSCNKHGATTKTIVVVVVVVVVIAGVLVVLVAASL